MWPPLDALLLLVIVSSITYILVTGKRKSDKMTPKAFLTCFQKALQAVKLLDCCYEKELDDEEAKVLFIYSFPMELINNYIHYGNRDFDSETLEDLKNFFQGHYYATPSKQPDCCNHQGQASCCKLQPHHLHST